MKKLILILISLALLCSCTETPPKEPDNENSSQSSESESVSQSEPETSQEQNETSEPTDPEEPEEPEFEFLFETEGIEVYKKRVETTETMSQLVFGKDGVPNSIIDVPEVEYWITDSDGNKLIEHPFYAFSWTTEYGFYNVDNQYPEIRGCYKGNLYIYCFINGKASLSLYENAGLDRYCCTQGNDAEIRYIATTYSYSPYSSKHGLADIDGNIIIEPISQSLISVPFEDRYIISTCTPGEAQDYSEYFYTLIDSDKNILCSFSRIVFHHFDDGSYIGVAHYYGGAKNWGHILKDENGETYEVGFRFSDKDGNVLSPCFDSVYLEMGISAFLNGYLDEVITTTDKDGKTVTFTARDYICKE